MANSELYIYIYKRYAVMIFQGEEENVPSRKFRW